MPVHEQYGLLDTILNYMFHFGPPEKHLQTIYREKTALPQPAIADSENLNIDIVLEVQIKNIIKYHIN